MTKSGYGSDKDAVAALRSTLALEAMSGYRAINWG